MKLIQQTLKLPIRVQTKVSDEVKVHGKLFPNLLRAAFIGASGSGKTEALLSLIKHANGLRFLGLYIFSKTLNQPKYLELQSIMKNVREIKYFASDEGLPPVGEIHPYSLIIFDDVICENQKNIQEVYSFGRHKQLSCIYLCQSFCKIKKHLLRENLNFLVVFRVDYKNVKHIYEEFVGADMNFEKFKNLCAFCWKDPFGFLVISLENPLENGRYRKGFDLYINTSSKM